MIGDYVIKGNFYFSMFEKNSIPPIYKSVSFKGDAISIDTEASTIKKESELHSYSYVPDYLKLNTAEHLRCRKIFLKKGFAANLEGCDSVERYLNQYCKTNFRGNVRRPLKRLESCLNVSYKMFCGPMDREEYTHLMALFHDMLKKRFDQRQDKNVTLQNWAFYLEHSFDSIQQKNASLFVMYNKGMPIAFSLNFHFNKVFYFAIPTFDLDYSKFTLGNIVIYKNLEWCIENGFSLFDMGYGGFENKLNWCNTSYNFEHHIISKAKNSLGDLYAFLLKHKYQLINYLIAKNVNTGLHHFINKIKGSKHTAEFAENKISQIGDLKDLKKNGLLEIDFMAEMYKHLRKPIYDFLYLNTEALEDITTYKVLQEKDVYYVKGKKSQIKIEHTHVP